MALANLPRHLLRLVLGAVPIVTVGFAASRPRNDRGTELDPQIHALLALTERANRPKIDQLGPERGRKEFLEQTSLVAGESLPLHRVEDRRIESGAAEIPVRIYTPAKSATPLPGLVYFHGGGFVIGNLDSHDVLCRYLARHAGAVVVSVDYRLAPEHPFPAAVVDSIESYRWVRENAVELGIDDENIAVGGDSAGGNLAAVVCQQACAAGEPMPSFQLLIYPATDMTRSAESHRTFNEGFFLTTPVIDWFVANYLTDPPSEERDPRASPLATADLEGLPPAHVAVAGFDPLRDEGEAYAAALMGAGVPTSLRCYGSLVHGFAGMDGVSAAAHHAVADLAEVLRIALYESRRVGTAA